MNESPSDPTRPGAVPPAQPAPGSGFPPGYGPPPGYAAPPAPYGDGPGGYDPRLDPAARSKIVAGILGIFLGAFGVHRFYLGFTKLGLLQILVTVLTCGLGSIWGTVEGVLYLVGVDGYRTDSSGRPLRD